MKTITKPAINVVKVGRESFSWQNDVANSGRNLNSAGVCPRVSGCYGSTEESIYIRIGGGGAVSGGGDAWHESLRKEHRNYPSGRSNHFCKYWLWHIIKIIKLLSEGLLLDRVWIVSNCYTVYSISLKGEKARLQ